ncbi:glycerophosphodiester phosphodiesterase family protein [Sphaerimonospora thailandensis]|uniref:Glycerophosphoryl diester phosphodiesterase n=1 Tax=Sphaerimonospora thailandensis TaxID=795644 RepID=A0A8J3RFD5_9ACTN|nr:glycerophosphodiester phosphodiesterase family protein [Sphaerimonospora thailandensis]GIH73251.1 glycerophosphoryl diester phosphodiesterase [Sphaerimonospora thailandensis]
MLEKVELHGHRGARGLRPENTLPGLAFALELGVDALEFDVAMSADGEIVLTHDLVVSSVTSADTGMAAPSDEMFPYVGKPIISLTLPQLRTLDVGVRLPQRPDDQFAMTQVPLPDTRMPTLGAVLGLIGALGADDVRLNVELKSDPTRPDLSADPGKFTELVVAELDRHDRLSRSAILSFDWRILEAARPMTERRYALVERDTMHPVWMNGLRPSDFAAGVAGAAAAVGATTLSPDRRIVDAALMADAARHGLPVVVWTVNDPVEAGRLIDMGVSAVVTDYPDRMRDLWQARKLPLAKPISPLRPVVA